MRIPIKGTIIPNDYKDIYNFFGIENTCPADVRKAIEEASEDEEIVFEVNSGGGAIFAGSEIYANIRAHPGNKRIEVVGFAGSAASFIACAAHCSMAPTAMIMVHNVSSFAEGDWQAFTHEAEVLKECSRAICQAYVEKTGLKESELLSLMDNETWISAPKALELGFVDEIMPAEAGLYNAICQILSDKQVAEARKALAGKAIEGEKLKLLNLEVRNG